MGETYLLKSCLLVKNLPCLNQAFLSSVCSVSNMFLASIDPTASLRHKITLSHLNFSNYLCFILIVKFVLSHASCHILFVSYQLSYSLCLILVVVFTLSHTSCHIHLVSYQMSYSLCFIPVIIFPLPHTSCHILFVLYLLV